MSEKSKAAAKCYMCDGANEGREHVPARTFFPKGYRDNLWTVPACKEHNQDNSKDVEYVAGCIISAIETTGVALDESQKKVFRAFGRSKGLLLGTFRNPILVVLPSGELTATFETDLTRFNSVMEALAYGIFFHENGATYTGQWNIVSPNLGSIETKHLDEDDARADLLSQLSKMPFVEIVTPQPDVFRCSVFSSPAEGKVIYRFEFYKGFTVYAVG
ncbi:MAG: hypothetical protein WCF57_12720 [Pyrinomonadaceae bacterium]